MDDKMRFCLLNLFHLFIEKFEISEHQGFFNEHNASSHPVNLFYCHLSSDEICSKLKQLNQYFGEEKQGDLINELFDSDLKFSLDFNGTIHYINDDSNMAVTDISNASFLEHVLQGEVWKLQDNQFNKSSHNLNDTEMINVIQNNKIFTTPLFSERVSIFRILQKVAVCNEYVMKMQVENSLSYLSSDQKAFEKTNDMYNLTMSKTQQPFQSMLGLASPSKTLINTNNNLSSFDASGINISQKETAHPDNLYWSNGIAYSGERINKEKIRKKSDTFLVRLFNSLCYKLGNYSPEDIGW